MATYPTWKASGLLDDLAGGKVTIGTVPGASYDGVLAISGDLLGIALGAVFVLVAFVLPDSLAGDADTAEMPAE
jgi:hypothetical protein